MKTTPVILTTAIISAASLLFTTTSGQAEVRSFSGGAATSGSSNNWSNAANWSGGIAPVEGDVLYFVGGGGKRNATINDYAAGTSFGGITFASTAATSYGLQYGNAFAITGDIRSENVFGNSIILNFAIANSDVDFYVASSGTLSLTGTISGSHGLRKDGAGTLHLTKANQITGDVVINQGRITVAVSNALGNGNALIINNGTLDFNVASTTTLNFSSLTGSTNALITNSFVASADRRGTINIDTTTNDLYEGSIIDGGSNSVIINKQGTGTLTITGTLAGRSTSTVSGGVLQIGNGGTKGTLQSNISNNAVLAFNRSDETTFANNSSGTGRLQQLGSGTLILTGSNSYGGGTDLVNGTIVLGSSNAITTSGTGTLNFSGGILKHTAENTRDYSSKIASIDAGKQARIDTGGQAVTYTTALKGDGGLEKRGEGSLTLNGVSIYTGATNVSAGTLLVNGSIATSSGVTVGTGGTLAGQGRVSQIQGSGTVGNGGRTILTASSVDGSSGLDFAFKFTNTIPTFNNAAASGNDLLRLTGANPFTAALNSSNTVTLDFSALSLEMGDSVLGGFFTTTDTLSSLENARYAFVGLGSEYGINVTMIQHLANFTGGSVNGYITQFTVVAIPEPTSIAMVLVGGGLVASRVLRRKKAA